MLCWIVVCVLFGLGDLGIFVCFVLVLSRILYVIIMISRGFIVEDFILGLFNGFF